MKRVLSICLVLLLVFGFSSWALSYNRGGGIALSRGCARGGAYGVENRADISLDLSDAEQSEIESLQIEHYEQSAELKEELWLLRDELRNLYYSEGTSSAEILSLQEEVTDLRRELDNSRTEYHLALREVLGAERMYSLEAGLGCLGYEQGFRRGSFDNNTRGNRGTSTRRR